MKTKANAPLLIASIVSGLVLLLGVGLFILQNTKAKPVTISRSDLNVEWYDENAEEFTITTREELFDLSKLSLFYDFAGQTIKLGADIVVNEGNAADWEKEAPQYQWQSIYGFAGTFDGQGHTISGIYCPGLLYFANIERVDGYGYITAALFRDTEESCVIKDFRLVNSYFFSDLDHGAGSISSNGGGTFDSIYSNAIIKSEKCRVGGIIGDVSKNATITNCWFDGSIDVFMKYGRYIGGIVGRTSDRSNCTVAHCLSTASLSSDLDNRGNQLGGLIGQTYQSEVQMDDCLFSGKLSGYNITGSVVGNVAPESTLTMTSVFTCADSFAKSIGTIEMGTLIGQPTIFDRDSIEGVGGYQWTTLDFENYWAAVDGSTPVLKTFAPSALSLDGIAKKLDTSWYDENEDEYVLKDEADFYGLAQLAKSNNFEGKTIKLDADLKLNEGDASTWGTKAPSDKWMYIGSRNVQFAGTFDGQMHTISGVYLKTSDAYAGLFGATAQSAVLKRFRLVNSYFESDQLGIGSIVGQAVGTFDTIYSSAIVVGDKSNIGGFIGRATDKPENTITITNCWFDGTVINKGTDTRRTGGFIGHIVDKITIEHCLNTGTVDVRAYTAPNSAKDGGSKHVQPYAGGIFGWISPGYEATIKDCLCAGKIRMSNAVTSAAGSVLGYATGKTTISDTYATEESSKYIVRGNTKGEVAVYETARITGYGGYQWMTLDFGGYWAAVKGSTPVLKSFAGNTLSLSGVAKKVNTSWYNGKSNVYVLKNEADFYGFAQLSKLNNFAGKTILLDADLKLNDGDASAWGDKAPADAWRYIGSRSIPFAGTFDGQMHTISGVYLKTSDEYTGLFGATAQSAVLKRFRLVNSYFESDQLGIGSIVGQAVGTFDTIYSSAIVVGDKSNIGGFIGRATDKPESTITITNCWFDGTVINKGTDTRRTGGFIGHIVDKITIEHCLNTGTVDVRAYTAPNSEKDGGSKHVQPYAGGIFGWISPGYEATIKDCLCAGKILMSDTVTSAAGSVLGYATGTTTISDTYATKESSAFVVRGTIKGEPTVYAAAQITGYDGYRWTTLDFGGYWAVSSSGTPVLKSFAAGIPSLAGVERMIDFSWYDASKSEYTLADAADLFGFAMMSQTNTFAGKTVKLGTDMDLNPGWEAAGETVPNVIWSIPIGSTSTRFNGVFDGQGHTISGMYLNATASYQGMFSGTGANAVVKDFKLKNSCFTSTGDCLGSIVGNAMGRFEKIYSAAIVKGYGNQVGGLIGATSSSGGVTMEDCCFDGSATIQNKKSYLGGLIGVITGSSTVSTISNCLHTGEVYHYGRPGIADVGGFVGLVQSGAVISDSVNHTNPAYTGGSGNGMFVGEASNLATLTLTNCHTINWAGKNLVGGVTDNEGTYPTCTRQKKADVAGEKSLTAAKVSDLFTSDSAKDHWVCSADSLPVLATFKDEYDTEVPVVTDTISISTAEELLQFAADSQKDSFAGKTVKLTANIDLNPGFTADAAGMTDGADGTPAQWTPIGSTSTRFNGTFDGQGYTISGMYLNASASYQGMFGGTGTDAVVKDFKLKNSYFTSTGNQLGSIVGNAMGTFEKIYSDAVVYGKSNYVGGLIGATSGSGTVAMTDCAFAGSVTMNAERSYLGGLIGLVQNSGTTIGNCLNTGEVYHKRGVGTSGTGCFVGRVSSSVVITDSVNHSNAQYTSNGSTQYYGLFVGYKAGSVTLTNCHTINYPFKDLVYGDANEIYDTCTRQNKADVAGEKSLTAAKVSTLFTSDSAKDHWVCSADSLPILAVFEEEYTAEEPTDPNTIYIATKEAFLQFAADSQTDSFAGKTVKLTANIDLNPGFTASTSGMTDGADGTPAQWTPIGSTSTRFNGTFDGQGHTISGMYLNASASYQGMFGGTGANAVVKDFKLKNSYFTSTGNQLGSIVGNALGTFDKIYSEAIVKGRGNQVGGLIGATSSSGKVTMTNCWFSGSATMNAAKSYLGGLIGVVSSSSAASTISNCLNTGTVHHAVSVGTADVGGFIGWAQSAVAISDSVNHSNPTYTAGSGYGLFVGHASNTGLITLTNCHSVNYGGKHLVSGVTDDVGAYPTCSRQNKADVAGLKALTVEKVKTLFTSDSAKGCWVCSADSLPVLSYFADEYSAGVVEES